MSQTATVKNSRYTTRELVLTALMAVMIAVCSWISIPAAVPFTLQTFGIACAVLILGGGGVLFGVIKDCVRRGEGPRRE